MIGYFGARVDGNIQFSKFFDEIRLHRTKHRTEDIDTTEVVEIIEAAEVPDAREITH